MKKAIFYFFPLAILTLSVFVISPVNVGAQTTVTPSVNLVFKGLDGRLGQLTSDFTGTRGDIIVSTDKPSQTYGYKIFLDCPSNLQVESRISCKNDDYLYTGSFLTFPIRILNNTTDSVSLNIRIRSVDYNGIESVNKETAIVVPPITNNPNPLISLLVSDFKSVKYIDYKTPNVTFDLNLKTSLPHGRWAIWNFCNVDPSTQDLVTFSYYAIHTDNTRYSSPCYAGPGNGVYDSEYDSSGNVVKIHYKIITQDLSQKFTIKASLTNQYGVLDPQYGYGQVVVDLSQSSSTPTGTLSVTPIGENILSGGTTTLIFTTHSNATSTLLNLVCPVGVSAKWINGGSSVEMCNVKKTFGRSAPSVFLQINNTTPVVQTIVPNFYEFLSDNPNYAVGVSSKITVQPEKTNSTIPCYKFNTNLNIGSTGPDVVALQTVLIAMGYKIPDISSGVVKKGYYGQSTADAVKTYQTAIGIVATGFFGPLTRASLNSTLCKNDSSVANILVRINPQTPPSRIQTTSTSGTTNGVVLGMFDFKSENRSSTITKLNFVLKDDGKNKSLSTVFNKIYLVVDGTNYQVDSVTSNLVFSNLKITLPQNVWKTVVLKADVADQDEFISGTTASTSIIASAYNIVGIDNDSKNTTSNGGNSATSNNVTFIKNNVALITNQTATIVGNDNGASAPTSATVTFGFTFSNASTTEDMYISTNPSIALATTSTIANNTLGMSSNFVATTPASISGDFGVNTNNGYYIIPASSSRRFLYTGIIDNKNGTTGLQSASIVGIHYIVGVYNSNPNSYLVRHYDITNDLEKLKTPGLILYGNSSVSVPVVSNTSATVVANDNGTSAPTSATATFKFTLTANDKDVYLSKKSALSLTTQAGTTASANYSSAVPATVAGDTSDVYVIPANVSRTFTYTGTLDNSKGTTGLVSAKVSFINYGFSYSNVNSLKITSGLEKLQTSPINLKGNSTASSQSTITISSPQSGQSLVTGNNYEIRLSSPVNDFVYYQIALKNKYSGTTGTMIANNVNKSTTSYSFKITDDMVKNVVANSGGNTADQIKNYYYVEALAMKPVYLKSNGAFAGYSYDVSGKSGYFTINALTYTPTPTINYSPSPIPTYSTVPTYSPTPAYTPTSTYSPTPTATNNPTPTPTTYYSTPTVTSTPSPSVTPISTPTPTYSPNPSSSPVSQSVTPTQTASVWDMIKKMFGF